MALRSSIEIYNIRTRQSRVVWQTRALFEAPNWSLGRIDVPAVT
jgi:hypothetical protein